MISVFGDESSSRTHASYGLLAIANSHLPFLDRIVLEAKASLRGSESDPLHAKVLFHDAPRSKSAFRNASRSDVEKACSVLLRQLASLEVRFFLGRVDRTLAPKVMHVPLRSADSETEIVDARMKLELSHLQFFAYVGAATRACDVLKNPAITVIADQNKSVVRWFNENRQANRLMELMSVDTTLPTWPVVAFASDGDHVGLQVADLLTYFATRQFVDQRFARPFDVVRHRTEFVTYEFAAQVFQPYVPPLGVSLKPLASRERNSIKMEASLIPSTTDSQKS
jgi:hypothetical protein